jgi:hypothetical protein
MLYTFIANLELQYFQIMILLPHVRYYSDLILRVNLSVSYQLIELRNLIVTHSVK